MIDTIKIVIQKGNFTIEDPDIFEPSARLLDLYPCSKVSKSGYFTCNFIPKNPKKKSKSKDFEYFPKMLLKRVVLDKGCIFFLRLEFSIPKLLFGNNFQEVMDEDFSKIIYILHDKLNRLGVKVREHELMNANVTAIHFSKNLLITEYASCLTLLEAISKVNIRSNIDVGQTDYNNNGRIVRFRANSYELCFYDKMKDLTAAYKFIILYTNKVLICRYMLDSVVLKIPLEKCVIEYANLFNPSFEVFQNSNIKVCSYFPTKKENQNKYYPKIQIKRHIISKYFIESFLLIEFSIPKLIYLNNYYEVDFEDFTEICTILQ